MKTDEFIGIMNSGEKITCGSEVLAYMGKNRIAGGTIGDDAYRSSWSCGNKGCCA